MERQQYEYLLNTLPPVEKWVTEMEIQAEEEHIPIMDKISMNFLMQLIRITKPQRILEVGTAIGYSALRMLEAYPQTSIVTIEKDLYRYNQAVHHITQLQKQANIQLVFGDATEEMIKLSRGHQTFDLVFIDAAKGEYQQYFELACPLLTAEAIVISDNILFRGYVANTEETVPKYAKIVEKIRMYNDWLVQHPDFSTTIVPIGDGIAISKKNR